MSPPRIRIAPNPADLAWMDDAACLDEDVNVFYPGKGGALDKARAICASCPVLEQCREYWLREQYGFAGGTTERERRKLRGQRALAPKNKPAPKVMFTRIPAEPLRRVLRDLSDSHGGLLPLSRYVSQHTDLGLRSVHAFVANAPDRRTVDAAWAQKVADALGLGLAELYREVAA